MGRAARERRDRFCPHCEKKLWSAHSEDLREHAAICQRASKAGLVLPSPSHIILTEDRNER